MLSQLLLEMDALHAPRRTGAPVADSASTAGVRAPSEAPLVIIGITNTPWAIDPSLLRPGRLEHSLFMPPPSYTGRAAILRDRLRRMPIACHAAPPTPAESADVNTRLRGMAARLADSTPGFSGADLHNLCQRAALVALQRQGVGGSGLTDTTAPGGSAPLLDPATAMVSEADFEEALKDLQPSVTAEMIVRLKRWSATRGSY